MKAVKSRRLVIDTAVVCAASESEEYVSSACRNALLAIRDICHKAVMTDEIKLEWDKHMSRFSRKWRVSMTIRKKSPEYVNPVKVKIDTNSLSDKDFKTVEKDIILLEAAFAADRTIVTLDDKFQKVLAKTPQGPQIIRSIKWINPVTDGCDVLLDI